MLELLYEKGGKEIMDVYCAARSVMNGSESMDDAAERYGVPVAHVKTMVQELVEMEGCYAKMAMGDFKKVEEIWKR